MNHEEQRQWLIQKLLDEDAYYKNYRIPEDEQEQKDLLRKLDGSVEQSPKRKKFLDNLKNFFG